MGFLPAFLWLIFIYKKDKLQPEPMRFIALTFAAGAISVIPVGIIELVLSRAFDLENIDTTAKAAVLSWLIAGFLEEGAKLLIVLLIMFKKNVFDEPMDGIIYAGASALGFAALENVLYIQKFGVEVILVRGPLSTIAHLLFSSFWGYALGLSKFDERNRKALIIKGFVLSAFSHGLFNFFLFTKIVAVLGVFILTYVLWRMLFRMIAEAQKRSPFA